MSDAPTPVPGTIGWHDLTVDEAEKVRDFYRSVAGWEYEGLSMGDYDDYVMKAPGAEAPVGGVCHARGPNAGLPPQWMIYIHVRDAGTAARACRDAGGEVLRLTEDPETGGGTCVIRDPAGAVASLFAAGRPKEERGDGSAQYEKACAHDRKGEEAAAIPCYREALKLGLPGEQRQGALLGLGSSLRNVGASKESVDVLTSAVAEFPDNAALKAFLALSLFSVGRAGPAFAELMHLAIQHAPVGGYGRALEHYAEEIAEEDPRAR